LKSHSAAISRVRQRNVTDTALVKFDGVVDCDAAAIVSGVIHAFGAHDQARRLLILAVCRERHPECFEIVGRKPCAHVSAWCLLN